MKIAALQALSMLAALQPVAPARTFSPGQALETVESRDGTPIAFERRGSGPVLVLVAPALASRSDATRLAALLAPHFTVFNYDRRGRGESGDTERYAIEREIEEIAALLAAAGGRAALFGSSSGAALALEVAGALRAQVTALILFEPRYIVDDSRPPFHPSSSTRSRRTSRPAAAGTPWRSS